MRAVGLAARRISEVDTTFPPVLEVGLALDHVGEHGRGGVLEIRHEHLGAGIQRVDDHLAVDGSGDLDPPVEEVGGDRGDRPVAVANSLGLRQEMRQLAGVEQFLPRRSPREQLTAAAVETTVQVGEESERLGRKDFRLPGAAVWAWT